MFSPIKSFITYIQKNASSNSIFGGNNTTEESTKMETENLKTEDVNMEEPESQIQDKKKEEGGKEEMETSKNDDKETCKKNEQEICKEKDTIKEDENKASKVEDIKISKDVRENLMGGEKETPKENDKSTCAKEGEKEECLKDEEKETLSKDNEIETLSKDGKESPEEKVKDEKGEKDEIDEKQERDEKDKKQETDEKQEKDKIDEKQKDQIDEKGEEGEEDTIMEDAEKHQTPEKSSSDLQSSKTKATTLTTTSTISAENSRDLEEAEEEVEDDEDIEAQIDSSIMIKKPVKVAATNGTEIVEIKRRNSNSSIVISHDYNRNMTLTPIDDELQDFRHDPTEVLGTSSSSSNLHTDEFCSVGSAEEAKERDNTMADDFPTKEDDANEAKEIANIDGAEETQETEQEVDDKEIVDVNDDDEDEEEPFLDLENFHNDADVDDVEDADVIVLDDTDLNVSITSVNTADDPLNIACEEHEVALEELNLLNTSHTSQDEDTTTTIDDDLQWLKTDLEDPQPSCSNSKVQIIKESGGGATATTTPEKEERNGEGSDSGLGSETSALHTTTTSITDTSQCQSSTPTATPQQTPMQLKSKGDVEMVVVSSLPPLTAKSPPKDPLKPFRSNLKRRLEVDDDVVEGLGNLTSSSSSATSSTLSDHTSLNGSLQKKPKRSINFDTVQVYYFPRQQGFSCVPSAGGCTLGMGARHVGFKTLTLAEHAAELRRAHRMQLQEINPRGSSSDDSEESEEDYLSEGSGSDLDGETNGFLQPVSPKQRRALLKAAGIRKIDPSEKADCRNIRNSREVCGCTCRDFCDPETCACSQSGIKCQVDRDMFPCGCSRDACGNTIGRVEFNPARVRTHFIHTLMRLEMENRQQQNPYSSAVASPSSNAMQPTNVVTPSSYYQSHLQPQSNYSSGYASPAYNTVSDLHQQTAASSYYNPQTPSMANSLYAQQQQAASLEMTHNSSTTTVVSSQYGIDSLDSNLFGGSTTAQPSYGELMPVASYHYANAQSQGAPYNSYHNTTIYHNATATTLNTPPNTYSSCAVPSIPPYGTATTTEATGVYHSVTSLTTLETTTAPSCNVTNTTTSLETDVSSSFISLSSPMASSSRLTQINDLLQHNRNTTTALVAVTQALGQGTLKSSLAATSTITSSSSSLSSCNGGNYNATSSSINTPPIEDAHKTCMAYEEFAPPLNPAPIVGVVEHNNKGSHKLTELPPLPPLTAAPRAAMAAAAATSSSELLQHTPLCKEQNSAEEDETMTAASTKDPTNIEVTAGN